jgi:hypothetical protein
MKKTVQLARCLLAIAMLLLVMPMSAVAEIGTRNCVVKEVLKGGMYVYIRCQEGNAEVWLATVDRSFKVDETIFFMDVPPMIDFYSKFLDRTFPAVILTDILKSGEKGLKAPASQ